MIDKYGKLPYLSAEDQLRFAEALIDSPAPNEALKRAMRLHLDQVEVK